jgi:hypothetical protein
MSSGAFEEFTGGFEEMTGGAFEGMEWYHWALGAFVVYLVWFLWANWGLLKAVPFKWNPVAKTEGMCGNAGLDASFGMATMPGGSGKFLVTGDSLNNSAGWLPADYAAVSNQAAANANANSAVRGKEGMWTGKRENLSNMDLYKRESMWGGAGEGPQFWDPNPYLTQAKEWGVPDLSGQFSQGGANNIFWGAESFTGLNEGQLMGAMNN